VDLLPQWPLVRSRLPLLALSLLLTYLPAFGQSVNGQTGMSVSPLVIGIKSNYFYNPSSAERSRSTSRTRRQIHLPPSLLGCGWRLFRRSLRIAKWDVRC
jgi:hypothetical protein